MRSENLNQITDHSANSFFSQFSFDWYSLKSDIQKLRVKELVLNHLNAESKALIRVFINAIIIAKEVH
jgi:hypothetical protein